jgi:hypothetical protein
MCILRTATFTIALEGVDEDALEAAAAAFTRTLHEAGLTPRDALSAWHVMDAWEGLGFTPETAPEPPWRRTMGVSRAALLAALRAAGVEGEQRAFVIQPPPTVSAGVGPHCAASRARPA